MGTLSRVGYEERGAPAGEAVESGPGSEECVWRYALQEQEHSALQAPGPY